jgi:hypothetical protein
MLYQKENTMKNFLLTAILIGVLVACGPARVQPQPGQLIPVETQQPRPTAAANWTTITFTQSGGIMGMSRTVTIQSDGSFIAVDERTSQKVSGQLTAEDIKKLAAMVRSLSIKQDGQSGVCADCFIYTVQIVTSGLTLNAQTDDVNLNASGLADLVGFLEDRMNGALNG